MRSVHPVHIQADLKQKIIKLIKDFMLTFAEYRERNPESVFRDAHSFL